MHKDKKNFENNIKLFANKLQFQPVFIEKDYYLTLILSKIEDLSADLVFKGGSCLNKVYFDYHRLSEDLDFTLMYKLPTKQEKKDGIFPRKIALREIESKMPAFAEQFSLKFINLLKQDGSRQHNYELSYNSVFENKENIIKVEIRARENNLISKSNAEIAKHKFIDPFDNKPLIDYPRVKVYPLKEIIADKTAATINRNVPRDIYDVFCALKKGFNFEDKEFIQLFKAKLTDDKNDTNLSKYKSNLNKTDEEIKKLKESVSTELLPMLQIDQKQFSIDEALLNINKAMTQMIKAEEKGLAFIKEEKKEFGFGD
jgi:predicted nucleotidyltransferase component of viral defense system